MATYTYRSSTDSGFQGGTALRQQLQQLSDAGVSIPSALKNNVQAALEKMAPADRQNALVDLGLAIGEAMLSRSELDGKAHARDTYTNHADDRSRRPRFGKDEGTFEGVQAAASQSHEAANRLKGVMRGIVEDVLGDRYTG